MFNVCPDCGLYEEAKTIDPSGPYAVCPHCDHHHPFLQWPLFIISGASGTGKSAICLELAGRMSECVLLESDILWRPEFDTPENDYQDYRNTWLRLAKNIGQAGRPVALFGSAVPAQFESCPERRYFSQLHTLALVCDDETLVERLKARPAWRGTAQPEFLQAMRDFNGWFKANAAANEPPIDLLDTTSSSLSESSEQVRHWILSRLPATTRTNDA